MSAYVYIYIYISICPPPPLGRDVCQFPFRPMWSCYISGGPWSIGPWGPWVLTLDPKVHWLRLQQHLAMAGRRCCHCAALARPKQNVYRFIKC